MQYRLAKTEIRRDRIADFVESEFFATDQIDDLASGGWIRE